MKYRKSASNLFSARLASTFLLAPVLVLATSACSIFGIESVEEAQYKVLQTDGRFEIREYAPVVVAETKVNKNFKAAGNSAFRKLFAYISGNNTSSEKIAMTAPVVAWKNKPPTGQQITRTTPITESRAGDSWKYRFILPRTYTLENAPRPLDPKVVLAEVPGTTVAAVRYSGFSSEQARLRNTEALIAWLESLDTVPASDPRWAGYNPPWTLPPFRRNEVLIDLTE